MTRHIELKEGQTLSSSLFHEPMRVVTVQTNGDMWNLGLVGLQSERYRKVTLATADLDRVTIREEKYDYHGDARLRTCRAPRNWRRWRRPSAIALNA